MIKTLITGISSVVCIVVCLSLFRENAELRKELSWWRNEAIKSNHIKEK